MRHEALAPDCTGPKGREEGPEHSVQVAGPWKARGQASAASVHLTPDQVASQATCCHSLLWTFTLLSHGVANPLLSPVPH